MSTLAQAIGGQKRIVGGPFGSKLTTKDYTEQGVPVIRGSNMEVNGRWIGGEYAYVSTEKFDRDLSTNIARPGDIIVTQRGTLGQVSIVPDDSNFPFFVVSQSQMAIGVDPSCADRNFVYYYLRSPEFVCYSQTQTIQTGVPHINLGILRDAPANFPPLSEQREIAGILGALDDKIEMNRKTAATLEAMARALYRSWFVDFDPVWARLEGRAPAHMDPATAALFPDRFTEDGLPEGWHVRPFAKVCRQVKETVKPMEAPEAAFWHFSLPAYDAGATPVLEPGSAIKSNKGFVPNDAILFSRLNPTIPRVWWARCDHATGTPAASTEFFVAKARRPAEVSWLYCLLSSAEFLEQAQSRVTGTSNSHQRVPPSALAEIEVIDAPEPILAAFGTIAGPMFEQVHALKAQSQTLASLRDSLLPRLMSGELRVGAARETVGEVA